MSDCPSSEMLSLFQSGTCDIELAVSIEEHLLGCRVCRTFCEKNSSDQDLMSGLRRVMDEEAQRIDVDIADQSTIEGSSFQLDVKAPAKAITDIEGYTILKELGRGGMGLVYLAVQQSTKRKVALKVLLDGPFATEKARRRFEREVELVAQLDHSNIVTILESGVDSGRYYFAMRYVEGQRLDKYIIENNVSRERMLAIFQKVCEAVAYAHQRGIIHRDLKPSNILVDGNGEPFVLDFGLAKSVDDQASELERAKTISVTGQLMGTLPYMSPEQASGEHDRVDVRTDIYSLGVILYEMLTGQFPYKVVGNIQDVLKNITEVDPKKPSLVGRRINDEIETIVLKALAKEKDRRYQSANAFADDLSRYLKGQPIEAKRDSATYMVRKMISRHRVPVTVAVAFLAIVAFSAWTWWNQSVQLAHAGAAQIMAQFVDDPNDAMVQSAAAEPRLAEVLQDAVIRSLSSSAYTERIMAARGGVLLAPQDFWKSIDGGALWENGEWLELANLPEKITSAILPELIEKAENGTDRQRYVSLCLIGQIAPEDEELAADCAQWANDAEHPGVRAAAAWAARRMGHLAEAIDSDNVFVDEVSGQTFARIPGQDEFFRGSDESDPDRLPDEDRPAQGVAIDALWFAETEVTWVEFEKFLADPAGAEIARNFRLVDMANFLQGLSAEQKQHAVASLVSKVQAEAYIAWLNAKGAEMNPPRSYRLPTEDEWEHAAMGGSDKRFCFGDDPKYARYFAHCAGRRPDWVVAGSHMPSFYGLFDMHGGVWEWTSTLYTPDETVFVVKGGAVYSPEIRCRSAQRNFTAPNQEAPYWGFRLIMELGDES
ncbi:MAG TPA: protein kinase [Phycisphaerae bacterium]|nr:protein kinase [Phycisphaerae bacterium]